MLILMQNYGIFSKIIVLKEARSKEAKRASEFNNIVLYIIHKIFISLL